MEGEAGSPPRRRKLVERVHHPRNRSFHRAAAWVVVFCLCALVPDLLLVSYWRGGSFIAQWRHHEAFDSQRWQASEPAPDKMWPPRLCMVDDLLERYDLHGWERSKVVALLGEPDKTYWDRKHQLVYYLGPERGETRSQSEWLVASLDDEARVIAVELARD